MHVQFRALGARRQVFDVEGVEAASGYAARRAPDRPAGGYQPTRPTRARSPERQPDAARPRGYRPATV